MNRTLRCSPWFALALAGCDGCAQSHRVDASIDDRPPIDGGHEDGSAPDASVLGDAGPDAAVRDVVGCGGEYCTDARPWCCPVGADFAFECWFDGAGCFEMPVAGEFTEQSCASDDSVLCPEGVYCCVLPIDDEPEGCAAHPLQNWTCEGS